ncbi:3'-5' exonuclease [Rhodococcus sp. D2-41]|uniref:3'-5' exonuclease n=1 Tax=Speluncibacter jeojiensis TaxID=2710754 RepID=UPI00240F6954|nr:exonuclease domain-containing protein [Rhodococcus sp. D2-41]MDG3012484.1 3'-5' exonuclease [Rhodococcus sp. D2-41]
MSDRQLIVVDLETTHLDTSKAVILEVAAINVTTGEELAFVPAVTPEQLAAADPEALAVNRYFERKVFRGALDTQLTTTRYLQLSKMLSGNTLAGANPRYDAAVLHGALRAWIGVDTEPWHFRLADITSITAGALGIDPAHLPGLRRCCDLLGVENLEAHSAYGDALATAECFRALAVRRGAH